MTKPAETTQTSVGRIAEIWIFPVKSMAGTSVQHATLDSGGLAGDRSWGVVDETGVTVTAAHEPRLREVAAATVDNVLRIDVPGAVAGLSGDAADAELSSWLGRVVHLAHREGTGFVDSAPVHVVSRSSITHASHDDECDACDIAAPRANIVLELDEGTVSERDWVGSTVTVGAAKLAVVRLPGHCLGVYAEVPTGGAIYLGDPVKLPR